MPRGKKIPISDKLVIDENATVECLDCKHKYKDMNQAMSYHVDETILTHRIKPIKTSNKTGKVELTDRHVESSAEPSEQGTPIQTINAYDQITDLIRKYPNLLGSETRELTRGMDIYQIIEGRSVQHVRQNNTQAILKEIPNYEQASKLSDATLAEYVTHSGNCSGRCRVSRENRVINVHCEGCKSGINITKR